MVFQHLNIFSVPLFLLDYGTEKQSYNLKQLD